MADEYVRGQRDGTAVEAAAKVVLVVAVVAGLILARDVIIPVALAALITFVLVPPVMLARRIGLPQVPACLLVVTVAFGLIFGAGFMGASQIAGLAENLPRYQTNIRAKIQSLQSRFLGPSAMSQATSIIEDIGRELDAQTTARAAAVKPAPGQQTPLLVEVKPPRSNPLRVVVEFLQPVLGPLGSSALVVVFVVFFLLQREDMRDRVISLLGTSHLHRTTAAMDEAAQGLSRYLLLQTVLNAMFGAFVGIALWAIGVPSPLLWAIFTMLMRFVPYVGSLLAAVLPAMLAAAVDPGWTTVIATLLVFLIGEPVMGQVIEPIVLGRNIGLSPVAMIIAATFWTWAWGPIGLVLAAPLTLSLVIIGQYTPALAFLRTALGDQPALTPQESFYQRLLAGDPAEIIEQGEDQLEKITLLEYYDDVALPALSMAREDIDIGNLDTELRARVGETAGELIEGLDMVADPAGDDAEEKPKAATIAPPSDDRGRILCLGARHVADTVAAAMLAQVLRRAGGQTFQSDNPGMHGALDHSGDAPTVQTVIVSFVGSIQAAQARYLVRRLKTVFPDAGIVLGLWCISHADAQRQAVEQIAGVETASTLREAVALIGSKGHEKATAKRPSPETETLAAKA